MSQMHGRGLGLIRDDDACDDELGRLPSAGEHFGAPRNLPTEALALVPCLRSPPRVQGQSGTCTGHGMVRAADTRLRYQGIKTEYGSPLAAYTNGRVLMRKRKGDRLEDAGAQPRYVLDAAARYGVPMEKDWPLWTPDGTIVKELNDELPPDVLRAGSVWKLTEQYAIRSAGESRVLDVMTALAQRYPLVVDSDVDEAFGMYDGKGVLTAPDPAKVIGAHMMALLAYRTGVSGKPEFLIGNSWLDWGMADSLAWVDAEWVKRLFNLYAFTLTAGPMGAAATQPEELAEGSAEEDDEA